MVAAFIESWKTRPFEWGESDCIRFASEFVKILTGKPALRDGEHNYQTAAEYKRAVGSGEMWGLIQDRLFALGFILVKRPSGPALAAIDMGQSSPALAVYDGKSLWMAGTSGAEKVETCTARQWWEYQPNLT